MQISIYVINNMPEPGCNLAADACMERTQLSPCIYNFSTRTIRASRNAMSAWYFFHAEPLISRFSLEIYITLLQQLWQTVLVWNLYPIFILLNQLAVKITPAESFLWMHLHQFQYLLSVLRFGIIRLNRKAPMYKFNIANYFITKNMGCRPGDECAKPPYLFKQAAIHSLPTAAAERFTEFYNGFIEEKFCERQRCDFLSYTLFPQLDIDRFLGCPWSELLG